MEAHLRRRAGEVFVRKSAGEDEDGFVGDGEGGQGQSDVSSGGRVPGAGQQRESAPGVAGAADELHAHIVAGDGGGKGNRTAAFNIG